MRKQAILKMIDTYIMQLNEIKEDLNSMLTEDTNDLTTCSNEAAAKYIVAMLKDRTKSDVGNILEDVGMRMKLLDKPFEMKPTRVHNSMNSSDIQQLLLDRGYRFITRLSESDSSKWVIIINSDGHERFGFNFDSDDLLRSFGTSFDLGYKTY